MDNLDDKTRIMAPRHVKTEPEPSDIQISFNIDGKQQSHVFSESFKIGRSVNCELVIPDEGVSRQHVEIELSTAGWKIKDLGSANGTFVNNVQIDHMLLANNDIFHFDNEDCIFTVTISNYANLPQIDPQNERTEIKTATIPITSITPEPLKKQATSETQEIYAQSDETVIQSPDDPVTPQTSEPAKTQETPKASATYSQDDQTRIQTPINSEITESPEIPETQKKPITSPVQDQQLSSDHTHNDVYDHYFSDKSEEEMGDHTRMVRKIIQQEQTKVQKESSSHYKLIIASVAILLVLSSAFIYYQQVRLDKAQSLAIEMFYDIKTLEVQVAQTEIEAEKSHSKTQIANISLKRQKLREMKERYQNYLDEISLAKHFKSSLSKEDEAIVQMAKIFGECDIDLPTEFISEVKKYIAKWQSSKRLTNAINRIERLGHTKMVVNAMHAANLAPQFLYLSLQESNFKFDAIGPETRFGIAKGAWQFMPETGKEFGLKIGPLAPFREHDPEDERFDFEKSSYAAAKYLKKIYSLEAQASGLLVMASYNWGHNRVKRIIKKMPNNPRERNFWKLTQNYKIPKETYDYVFYIFSAAVIGDNPELFGFDFKNPLLMALENTT